MRTRHPFPDIEDTAPETVPVEVTQDPTWIISEEAHRRATRTGPLMQLLKHLPDPDAEPVLRMHDGENRLTRRIAVSEFDMPVQPGLRRMLLKQRQRQRRGKMDVELNRLRRRKAKQHE